MQDLWTALILLIWAMPAAGSRILLQWAMDKETSVPFMKGLALFAGSLLLAVTAAMICTKFEKTKGLAEVASAACSFLAQDVFVVLVAAGAYYRKKPGELINQVRVKFNLPRNNGNDPHL
jgi:uncharacterized membrane protein